MLRVMVCYLKTVKMDGTCKQGCVNDRNIRPTLKCLWLWGTETVKDESTGGQ